MLSISFETKRREDSFLSLGGTKVQNPIASSFSCLKERPTAHILWDRRWGQTLGARVGFATLTLNSQRPKAGPSGRKVMVGTFYVHPPTNASSEGRGMKMLKTEMIGARQRINARPSIRVTISVAEVHQSQSSCDVSTCTCGQSEAICVPTL